MLDTNVVSELRKRDPDPRVLTWYAAVRSADLFLSGLTIGEIRLGIERLRRKDSTQAGQLENWLHGLHPVIDGLLAASAKVHGWTLVTRHPADLARTGVTLHNPFRPN